ncbi:MAG: histidine kinase [Lachnospiraceae bacterium]|nr:histidine kinase [Lachnospiraceae bacterium]
MKKKSFRRQILLGIVKSGILAFIIAIILSFLIFFPILKKHAITSAESTNAAVLNHLESTLAFVENHTENIAVAVEENNDIQNYFSHPTVTGKTAASVTLNNFSSYMRLVRGIAVSVKDIPVIDSITNFTEDDYALFDTEYFKEIQASSFSRSYSSVYQTTIGYNSYNTVAYTRNFYLNNRWCTIIMFINLNNVLSDIKAVVGDTLDAYYLTDSRDQAFYPVGSKENIAEAEKAAEDIDLNGRKGMHGDIVFTQTSAVTGYGLVSMIKGTSILALLLPYSVGLFLAMLGLLLLILVITSRSMNAMIKPVIDLSELMLRAAGGDLNCRITTMREDEIGLLETSFNKMIDDLKESIEVISEKEAHEQQTKFSLLVSQIDPHFIYNTINSINYLARRERCADIVKVNTALIAILRDRLRVNDIQITDTVANEVRVVNQYLEIERFMYGGDLRVTWDVEKEVMEAQIPKNMIQPLVENALFHGLIDEENGELNGTIQIHIHQDENTDIVLCVEDDGLGMDAEKLEQVRNEQFSPEDRGSKIGLANIRGRLYYLYDNNECMTIESSLNKGTSITIRFTNK